jgi:hypothetical protein
MNRKIVFYALTLLLLGAAFTMPKPPANAAEDIEQMIATAKTPADQEAVAAYFDREATEARSKAELHRRMAKAYGLNRELYNAEELVHCEKIARAFDRNAEWASKVAEAHRKMAKESSH